MSAMFHLRAAAPGDYPAFTRLFGELAVDDPPAPRERWQADLMPATVVAERDGEVVGYCYFQLLQDSAYVRNVAVAPAGRRAGIGRALMETARAAARARGLSRWQLNVKPDNDAAIALYRSLGMRPAYTSTALRFPWSLVAALPAPPRPTTARLLEPARFARVEQALRVPAGLDTEVRTDRVLLELTDAAGTPLGYARFSPGFPGAFPFRLAEPALARPLLEEMQRHARPGLGYTQVVVEDDAALTALLCQAGAEVRERIVHYEGSL
jgi:GNAT superfamily N-acetyltransferase